MDIAILTDIPILCEDGMYLDRLKKGLSTKGIHCKVFLITQGRFFKKFDSVTGIMRIMNTAKLLSELSNFNIIHVQFTFPLGFAAVFLASLRLLRRPIIVHTHGYDVFTVSSINYGIRRKTIGRVAAAFTWNRADKIIVVCRKAKNELESVGIQAEKMNILYNGTDASLFSKQNSSEMPKELSSLRRQTDLIFLSIASLNPVKNHVKLVKAFKQLNEKYKSRFKIKLLMIGWGSSLDSVNLSYTPNLVYLGKKNHLELPQVYSMADVFVLPSLSEAHPWSMLEAMSCELPVVASNVGGIPETLDPKLLVDPHDTQSILKKLELVTEMNKKEREEIGAINRKKILDYYTFDRHLQKLIEIYEHVLNK